MKQMKHADVPAALKPDDFKTNSTTRVKKNTVFQR